MATARHDLKERAGGGTPPPAYPSTAAPGSAGRARNLRAFLPVVPLLVFLVVVFLYPVVVMLFNSVDNGVLSTQLPRTSVSLANWKGGDPLPDSVFAAVAEDLAAAKAAGELADVATRLNYRIAGFRSLVMQTQRALADGAIADRNGFLAIDERWNDTGFWIALKRATAPYTYENLLAVVDLELADDDTIVRVPRERRVYLTYLLRTIFVSLSVTVLCLLIGYPIAYAAAHAEGGRARLLLLLILLPFWTSLLVRTAAWVVILQKQGILNGIMIWLGILNEPIQLVFNRVGVLVGMTHVLLPFAVLPIYSVMRGIGASQLKAASSLGARPFTAFLTVYLPQTMPGIIAGGLLVFVLANGFYITPALLGGANDQLISSLIADFALGRANWGMASALALVLLLAIAIVFVVFGPFSRTRGARA